MAKQKEPLVKHIYTADPSAHVFNGKIYVYPSHDLEHDGEDNDDGDEYQMEDYHILSMDDVDAPCIDNGEALNMRDVPWVSKQMWAPDCAEKNGKYYLFFPARDKKMQFHIGVAVSDNPVGPFKPEPDYIKGSFSIDPAVLVDDDGSAYIYFGGLWGGQLEKWQTGEFVENPAEIPADAKALGPQVAKLTDDMLQFEAAPQEITILDENGEPIKAGDEDRRYFEGPWMHKYNGKYYLSYSTGTTHYLVYAIGDSPMGPFKYAGRILEPVIGWTTHHSIVEYKGKWYLFYHDSSLSGGVNHRRCVKFRELKYDENGKIITMKPYED
ncbi:MAG: glycoside hydrolase family 43 protein [Lachnospiraceae bacterium]|nr:glycoside hydrolase family 43 protein [Lachnospiraceae bacterium]